MTAYRVLLGGRGLGSLPRRPSQTHLDELAKVLSGLYSIHHPKFDLREAEASSAAIVAESVALLCPCDRILDNGAGEWELVTSDTWLLQGQEFHSQQGVERSQSAFLVADNILLTSVHNLDPKYVPEDFMAVFDFKYENGKPRLKFSAHQVFEIDDYIKYGKDTRDKYNDWLLLRLRGFTGRKHLDVADADPIQKTAVWTMGHPLGLPMKFADGASVKEVFAPVSPGAHHFDTDLDAVEGSSGSPVVDESTGNVVGLVHNALGLESAGGGYTWRWCEEDEDCPTEVTSCTVFHDAVADAIKKPAPLAVVRHVHRWLRRWKRRKHVRVRERQGRRAASGR